MNLNELLHSTIVLSNSYIGINIDPDKRYLYEIFRPVTKYETDNDIENNRFFISNMGRLYDNNSEDFVTKIHEEDKFVYVILNNSKVRLDKIILRAFNPRKTYTNLNIKYRDGNKDNLIFGNLIWSDEKNFIDENVSFISKKDMKKPENIEKICKMLEEGTSKETISNTLNIPLSFINKIKKGEYGRDISENYNIAIGEGSKYFTKNEYKALAHYFSCIDRPYKTGMSKTEYVRKIIQLAGITRPITDEMLDAATKFHRGNVIVSVSKNIYWKDKLHNIPPEHIEEWKLYQKELKEWEKQNKKERKSEEYE